MRNILWETLLLVPIICTKEELTHLEKVLGSSCLRRKNFKFGIRLEIV